MNPQLVIAAIQAIRSANQQRQPKYGYFQHPSGQMFEYQMQTPDFGEALGSNLLSATTNYMGAKQASGQSPFGSQGQSQSPFGMAGFGRSSEMPQNTVNRDTLSKIIEQYAPQVNMSQLPKFNVGL